MPSHEVLNENQMAAVEHDSGALLIVAGPGSGKTRVITHRIAHQIAEHRVPGSRILAVTFTNKAAKEMKNRIADLLPSGGQMPLAATFHSFCARLLRSRYANDYIDPSYSILDSDDQITMVKEAMARVGMNPGRNLPRNVLRRISRAKNWGIKPKDYAEIFPTSEGELTPQNIAQVYACYQEHMLQQNCLDFDDLLVFAVDLLQQSEPARNAQRNRYRQILVDEFQDINDLQYQLLQCLTPDGQNTTVVGDPDQAIYSWRGARSENLNKYKNDYRATLVPLGQNYRSTKSIVAASTNVIERNSEREQICLFTENHQGPAVTVKLHEDLESEAEYITKQIGKLLKDDHSLDQIAVLYRNNRQSRLLETALAYKKIPYRLVGGLPFWSRREIKDITAYLTITLNPENRLAYRRVLSKPTKGIGPKTADRIFSHADAHQCNATQALYQISALAVKDRPGGLHTAGPAKGIETAAAVASVLARISIDPAWPPSRIIKYLLDDVGLREHILSYDNPKERLDNIDELLIAAQQYDSLVPPEGVTQMLADASLVSDRQAEVDAEAVTLSTLHRAKGLEWEAVFIAGMTETILPSARAEMSDRIEEERRLCYVGMTRARESLYLSAPEGTFNNYQGPSRFIEEIQSS